MAKNEILTVKEAVHKLQLSLLEGIHNESLLFAAGSLISRSDYEDVVIERSISNHCGYPLCNNSLPLPSDRTRKGRYRISLKEHKVYDLNETYMYCSTDCVVNSRTFAEFLQPERCDVSNSDKINEILKLFGDLSLNDRNGFGKKEELGFSDLKIEEKLDVKMGKMSLEDWIGPSNAIEGYVPVIDRSSKPSESSSPSKHQKSESKSKSARPKTDKSMLVNDLDFTSTIIVGDQIITPELSSSDTKVKDCMLKLEDLERDKFNYPKVSSGPVQSGSELKELNEAMSSLSVESQFGIPEMLYDSAENVSNGVVNKSKRELSIEKKAELNEASLKSSIKCSDTKKLRRSVTWADEERTSSTSRSKTCEVHKMSDAPENVETSSNFIVEDDIGSIRLESAEACALALSQAAEAVASGEVDVTNAVSEAGIMIFPQPHEGDNNSHKDENMTELDSVPLKWPTKPGVLNSEVFGPEDSWYDPPPEGFSLNLSSFATMYMALFGWTTSSFLAYIYGQDENSHEEFSLVNGREYPYKIVLSDGRSSEIKLAMAGCLSRALPKVATDLRLKTPISTIEKEVGHLLNTMSFVNALPSFKLKQWLVIAILFIDALSVCRIPGVATHMRSERILLQKVFDDAQVRGEEYEIMKDLLIPLGRVPQFSAQSGA
ncbi:Rna polymerase ii subunit b1 ctd phosphatase rpap2-like protein [Thalictrum thalictroides]|uniref:RNA polymerase II subunit B1 CTD phosphatase RPAP2 homolog n=1 Tax=Thalictrum thalictroides TaxID=46969 RepID=A0A7J6WRJ6_THATH|nr:Rna polymerase ii subunit b1 ctd phosphatase rpap2-like protein [Thalictrum thalictroides]